MALSLVRRWIRSPFVAVSGSALVLVGALCTSGCGNNDNDNGSDNGAGAGGDTSDSPSTAGGAAGSSGDGGASTNDPLFLVSTSVLTDSLAVSYLTTADSLAEGPILELDQALEFGGGARAFGTPESGFVYVTSSEEPTLTEVKIRADGSLAKGRVLSFANLGVGATTGANVLYFASPTKAYFISQDTQDIIVWDPSEMSIVKTVPLDLPLEPTSTFLTYYPQPIVSDGKLVVITNESDDEDMYQPPIVSVIDPMDDSIISTTRETRCPGIGNSAVDKNGDRYFAQDSYANAVHFKQPSAPAPCMLRIRKGETRFDPEWSRTLDDDLGTGLWTGVTPGRNGSLYVQAIPEDNADVLAAEDPYSVTIAEPWTWYSLSDGDAEPVAVESTFLRTPPLFPDFAVGESRYVTTWDQADTTLIDLTTDDVPRQARQVRGFVYNIIKVR